MHLIISSVPSVEHPHFQVGARHYQGEERHDQVDGSHYREDALHYRVDGPPYRADARHYLVEAGANGDMFTASVRNALPAWSSV